MTKSDKCEGLKMSANEGDINYGIIQEFNERLDILEQYWQEKYDAMVKEKESAK